MPRPVSQDNIDKAITALHDNPDITGKQFQELSGLSRATAYQALRVARDQSTSDHSETGDNGNGSKGDNPVISDNLSSETGDNSDQSVISDPGSQGEQVIEVTEVITDPGKIGVRVNEVTPGSQLLKEPVPPVYGYKSVSRLKVEQTKKLLTLNPSITGKQVAKELQCSEDAGQRALKVARQESLTEASDFRDRVRQLQETKAKKAIEASEMQVRARLKVMRANCEALQQEAEATRDPKTLEVALKAWRQLTEYERQVTGIAQAERRETAATGKTELTLQLPVTPDQLDQIKPV